MPSRFALPSRLVPVRWRRVFALYLQYGEGHHASGMAVLRQQVARLFPGSPASFLVIDNALDAATPPRVAGDETTLAGDNANREFSGWDRGLRWLRSSRRVSSNDVVLLANDTFHRSYGSEYLAHFSPRQVDRALRRHALLGYMDAYPEPVTLFSHRLRSWVRSSFVISTARTLFSLQPLQIGDVDPAVFSPILEEFFRRDAPLCERYRGYLKTWLFGEPAGPDQFRERWHSQAALSAANLQHMRAKARCILAEHLLSARARALGVPVLDIRGGSYDL
jgi:hypothetical protein